MATLASCSASWNYAALGIDAGGSGSALASSDYGSLHGTAQATTYFHQTFEGDAQTMSTTEASFTDTLTFPGLSSTALLQVTIAVSGKTSGDLTFVDTAVNAVLRATASETNFNFCELQSLQGVCSANIFVSPGDTVQLFARLGLTAMMFSSGSTIGTDSMSLDYRKPYGATLQLALVDSNGKVIRGPQGKIQTASGTKYHVK